MGILQTLSRKLFGPGAPAPAGASRPAGVSRGPAGLPPRYRGFDAAAPTRTTTNWSTVPESSNRELRYNLRNLRARSRALANNNEYGSRFLDLCTQNIVGPDGVDMEPQGKNTAGQLDAQNNEQLEEAWDAWGRKGVCTVDGMLSWIDAQQVICECVARDGEVLVKPIIGAAARNDFGFAIQILEADYLDDLFYETNDSSGAGIFMGVEVDGVGRVVNYYVLNYNPADYGYAGNAGRTKVAATDLWHIYVAKRAHQRRGVPWMSSAMLSLYQVGDFKESELTASRVAAGKMAFMKANVDGAAPMSSDEDDENDAPVMEVEPGIIERLPYGWDVQALDWRHPNTDFAAFVKASLRGSAAGMGVGYNQLASDLENVNYSSLREGRIETVDLWRKRQRWFRDWVCQPIFSRWLDMAILTGKVQIPARKAEAFRYPIWRGRGWGWIDPEKEANANRIGLALGLRTRTEILAEQGKDFGDTIEELAAEQERMTALGLNPDVSLPGKSASPGVVDAPNDAPADEGGGTDETPTPAKASSSAKASGGRAAQTSRLRARNG